MVLFPHAKERKEKFQITEAVGGLAGAIVVLVVIVISVVVPVVIIVSVVVLVVIADVGATVTVVYLWTSVV